MKNLKALLALILAAAAATGCTTAYYGSKGSGFDDLYATHDRVAIANKQKAEADQNENNGTDTEVHQVLHQDITGIHCSCKAGFHHCESCLHPEYQRSADQKPDTEYFAV